MPTLLEQIQALVAAGRWDASGHGRRRMATRAIPDDDLLHGVAEAVVVESYPDEEEGPCLLALQYARNGAPIHVVWGFKNGPDRIAWVITTYYPGLDEWEANFVTRRSV